MKEIRLQIYTIGYRGEKVHQASVSRAIHLGIKLRLNSVVPILFQGGAEARLSFFSEISRIVRQYTVEADWHTYCFVKTGKLRHLVIAILKPAGLCWALMTRTRVANRQRSLVEQAISAKHMSAVRRFVDDFEAGRHRSNWMLVLESDALFADDSITQLSTELLLQDVSKKLVEVASTFSGPVYFNLAGGFLPSQLGLDFLHRSNVQAIQLSPPSSNTSCAYLVNLELAKSAVEFLILDPRTLALGIDWIWNLIIRKSGATALLADPLLIKHGSRVGETVSWNPQNQVVA